MTERARQWLTLVDVIAESVGERDPLTFVLGAGASLSSGAPSSARVERRWMESDPTSFPDRQSLLERIGELGDSQKINPIRSLFESVRPFIGYHCLASLAHARPVFVINLNWDDALEQACQAISVPFRHLTVDRKGDLVVNEEQEGEHKVITGRELNDQEPGLLTAPSAPGVYCLQVHGKLDDPVSGIRFGIYHTLQFTPLVKRVLVKRFFTHPTVVVGASLRGEYDVVDLLRTLTEDSSELPGRLSPFFVFSRQETRTSDPTDKLMQHVLFKRSSEPNFRGDPAVDFDRLLLDLATRIQGSEFGSAFSKSASVPSLEELVLPSPKALGVPFRTSDHYAVVIEGEAKVGKSAAACLLGHLAYLCERDAPSIETHEGPVSCAEALETFDQPAEGEASNRILILEDPFGRTGMHRKNPGFAKAFKRYLSAERRAAKSGAGRTRVVITSRAGNWRRALAEQKLPVPRTVLSTGVNDWYTSDELTAYLESKVTPADKPLIRRDIHKGELATPAAIEDAVSKASDRREEVIRGKVEFLRSVSGDAQWCAVLARLQELWPDGVSDLPLHRASDRDGSAFAEVALMLRTIELDGASYVIPSHSTDREAIDAFFAESCDAFSERLSDLARKHGSPKEACRLWSAIRALRDEQLEEVRKLDPDVRLNWGATLLEEAARASEEARARAQVSRVRELLLTDSQTFWSMREVVFETIRSWPLLRDERSAQRFLDETLEDRKMMGCYLVLDAMLYVQAATYPGSWDVEAYARVWDKLANARHALFDEPREHIQELALMFDAFAWCPPRLEPHELRRWVQPLIDLAETCPPLGTVMLCSSLHHPDGIDALEQQGVPGVRAYERPLTEEDAEIASFLTRWHFVHQSRGRALLYRRSLEPVHPYLLHRIRAPTGRTLIPAVRERCRRTITDLARFPAHAGWAIHLAMNIAATRVGFDPSFVARCIRQLPDADPGAITAVMTYEVPRSLLAAFVAYFEKQVNRDALLDALSHPPQVEGVAVGPPPFCASRRPLQLYQSLDISWETLQEDGIPIKDEYAFLEMLHTGAAQLHAESEPGGVPGEALSMAVKEIVSGDLRRFARASQRALSGDRENMTACDRLVERLKSVTREIAGDDHS